MSRTDDNKQYLALAEITFNIDCNEISKNTDFPMRDIIKDAVDNYDKLHFKIDDKTITMGGGYYIGFDRNNGNIFELPIDIEADYVYMRNLDKEMITKIKQQVIDNVNELVNYLNSTINIILPIDNLNNVIYNKEDESFYAKIGEAQPTMEKLTFSFNQTNDNEIWWNDLA